MTVRPARPDDLPRLAEIAAGGQADPQRFVAYVGDDAASIAAEVAEVDDWPATTVVAVDEHGDPTGWLLAELDAEMGRAWWWGPFVDTDDAATWRSLADALVDDARHVADGFAEQELAVDDRSDRFRELAADLGFSPDPGSVLLRLDPDAASLDARSTVDVAPLTPDAHDVVIALHDETFVGTHTPGAALVRAHDERHPRYVALLDGAPVGYVAVEHQPDASVYVDFLGVAVPYRERGIGRQLVAAAVRDAFAHGAERAHLTVREANAAARALYASLGFVEERLLRPYRRGFTLP